MNSSLFGFEVDAGVLSFIQQDFTAPVIDGFYAAGPLDALARELNDRVKTRTAYWTGALRDDETYQINTDKSSEDLIVFYVTDVNQLAAWGRTYARFIEGPTLGYSSPTISNPSHMYARMETEDIGIIDLWGAQQAQAALDKIAAVAGP